MRCGQSLYCFGGKWLFCSLWPFPGLFIHSFVVLLAGFDTLPSKLDQLPNPTLQNLPRSALTGGLIGQTGLKYRAISGIRLVPMSRIYLWYPGKFGACWGLPEASKPGRFRQFLGVWIIRIPITSRQQNDVLAQSVR